VPDERIRWLVGYFIGEMADVDYLMSDVVVAIGRDAANDGLAEESWGQSGTPLASLVGDALAMRGVTDTVSERYRLLYEVRNNVTHGMWQFGVGSGDHGVLRLRRKRGTVGAFQVESVGVSEAELWRHIRLADQLKTDLLLLIGAARA